MSIAEKDALKTLIPELMDIPASKITYPNMPVAIFALEMESLRETYLKDTPYYVKRNIDTAILAEKLDLAVAALRASEIDWAKEIQASTDAKNMWKGLQNEAYDLRDEAEASLDFVLPEDSDARRQLDGILKGTGHADMILDLGKLARLCRDTAPELAKISFSGAMINRLDELYTMLTDIYGKVTSDKADLNEARILRDRTFVYCKGIERQIKRAARLVLRKEPALLKRYRSEYFRKNRD
jgi:hypothetical protein